MVICNPTKLAPVTTNTWLSLKSSKDASGRIVTKYVVDLGTWPWTGKLTTAATALPIR
jgi:hypothetical protein